MRVPYTAQPVYLLQVLQMLQQSQHRFGMDPRRELLTTLNTQRKHFTRCCCCYGEETDLECNCGGGGLPAPSSGCAGLWHLLRLTRAHSRCGVMLCKHLGRFTA